MSVLNVRVTQKQLAEAVSWAAKRTATLSTSPILAGLLIETSGDNLVISATDHQVSGCATVDAVVEQEGRVLVSARLMERITSTLTDGTVSLSCDDSTSLNVTAGKGRFRLPLMPAEDYPQLPELPPIIGEVDAATWANGVRRVVVAAMGRDAAPHWLADVLIETGDSLSMVATNRYQLSTVDLPWQPTLGDQESPLRIQINAALLAEHAKALRNGNVTLHCDTETGVLGLTSPGRQATMRLSAMEWNTAWRRLIPAESPISVAVPTTELDAVLKRAAALDEVTSPTVLLELADGQLHVTGDGAATDSGVGSETLDVDFDKDPLAFRVRIQYLRDALAQTGTDFAVLGMSTSNKPATVRRQLEDGTAAPDCTHLIMPIRMDAPATARGNAA
jgi:DNA polymerase-3 subunit beta